MADPLTFRLNDKTDPDRNEKFFAVAEDHSADVQKVLRRLVDACLAYEKRHKRFPRFPVVLVPEDEYRKLRAAAGLPPEAAAE